MRVGGALQSAPGCDGFFVAVNNRVTQSVPHLHVHVIPRTRGDGLRGFFGPRQPYRDEAHLEQVRKSLADTLRQLRLERWPRVESSAQLATCRRRGSSGRRRSGRRFCHMKVERPLPLDPDEPENLARAAHELELKYLVVTSVDRDDLPDGGASHFARAVAALRRENPALVVEVLIPDFQGSECDLDAVAAAGPHPLRLSYLPFIAKALVAAFGKHPLLNVNFDEAAQELVVRRAVEAPELLMLDLA
jgi:hypothetical protein